MTFFTLCWITFPFVVAFSIYLLPRLNRMLALAGALWSGVYALVIFLQPEPLSLRLVDHFGVSLELDSLAAFFIITNALVTIAVLLYSWTEQRPTFFYTQVLLLHGSVNAALACMDFISLYVALELLSIATFLLIVAPRCDRTLWIGLRYLFVSNIALLFYLVGALFVYQATYSFDFRGLAQAPPEATALIFTGLLVKGGIFVSGLWLPVTHAESESAVSALMSGVVVKAAILPMARCALLLEEIDPIVRLLGVATAVFGVGYAVFEKDLKRMLAFHTISQLGFILAAPEVGGFYALTHGLVKAALFLGAGVLPSRDLKQLASQPLPRGLWAALAIASFSISGFPLLSGYGAKILTMENLLPWQVIGMNIAALGTAISFAKLIFLTPDSSAEEPQKPGFWWAMAVLLGGLVGANLVYYDAYTWKNVAKPLITIGLGWLTYGVVIKRVSLKPPRLLEQFEHLMGMMVLTLVALFWIAVA